MTGYIFIIITVMLNSAKGFCSKKVSGKLDNLSDVINTNLLRNILCVMIGAGIILLGGDSDFFMPANGWIFCTVSGITLALSYIIWLIVLKTDAYLLASTANNSDFVIAIIGGLVLFDEKITVCKGVSIVMISIAVIFMTRYNFTLNGKFKTKDIMLLLSLWVIRGAGSIAQKWYTISLPDVSVHLYTFYSFAVSVVFLGVYRMFISSTEPVHTQMKEMKTLFPWTLAMAIALYAVTFFQTKAAALLDAVVVYPVNNALNLTFSGLMAWLCFGEKPNKFSIIGMIFVFAALVLSKF